jgi:hypothetical protein
MREMNRMHPAFLSTAILLTLTPLGFAAQTGSEIHVLGQDKGRLQLLIDHQGSALATLRITDGDQVDRIRIAADRETRYDHPILLTGKPLDQREIAIELLDAASGDPLVLSSSTIVEPLLLADEPTTTLTPLEIRVLRKNWGLDARTARILDHYEERNDKRLTRQLLVPKTGGAWREHYRCPDTSVRLEMINFTTHRSPATGRTFTGTPYDEAVVTYRHLAIGKQALEMATMYQMTGNMAYAQRAADILLSYGHYYPTYPLHDRFGGTRSDAGRAFSQSLDEAIWLTNLLRARDLLRGSGLINEAENQMLCDQLWTPAMEVLRRAEIGIYNIQCWHNSALFLAAIETGDYVSAHDATFGPTGTFEQMAQGIQPDGIWNEGSLGYHFFALRGMLPLVQATTRTGVDFDYSRLREMYVAAWNLIQPDYTLPQLNDGALESFETGLRDEFEQGLALFPGDRALNDPLGAFGRGNTFEGLLWGADTVISDDIQDVTSVLFDTSGIGVLRTGPLESRTMAILDYGPHGGYHGHLDKLGLTLWMKGGRAIAEAGSEGYGSELSDKFFRSTLAHSTIVVDGMDQQQTTGTSHYFETEEGVTISASSDGAYPGVGLRRLVHVTEEGHAADLFEATGTSTHTFDYVLHGAGTVHTNLWLTAGTTGFSVHSRWPDQQDRDRRRAGHHRVPRGSAGIADRHPPPGRDRAPCGHQRGLRDRHLGSRAAAGLRRPGRHHGYRAGAGGVPPRCPGSPPPDL